MKNYLLHIVLFFCITQVLHSQEDGVVAFALPVRNSLKFNKYVINPTFSFVREQNKYVSFTNKRQWAQFDNAPQTYLFSYAGRFSENAGIGVGLFQQNYGVLTTFGGVLNFAHNAVLDRDSNLTFGVNLGFYKSGINEGNVVTNFPDPSLENIPSNSLITVNPGINYGTTFLDFGVSLNNIVLYNLKTSELVKDNPEQSIQAHVMYTGYVDSRGFFDQSKFSSLVRSEFSKDKTIISGIVMLTIPKGMWSQIGYNTLYGVSGGIGFNISKQIAIEYNFEKAIGDLSGFGNSHEITLAYKFNKKGRYNYSDDDDEGALIKPAKKVNRAVAKPKNAIRKKPDTVTNRKLAAEAKAKADAEARAKLTYEKVNANEENKIRLAEEAQAKVAAEEAKTKVDEAARLKLIEDAKIKADADAQTKLATEVKARADEETRLRLVAETKVKLAAEQAKAKADEEARIRLEAENNARIKAEAQVKADAEQAKAKADEEARIRLEAENNARIKAEAQVKADAEAKVKLAAEQEKAKADEETRIRLEAQAKTEAESKPIDESIKSIDSLKQITDNSKKEQEQLLTRLSETVAIKAQDLKDLKEENDLSEQGIFTEPKPFKSVTAENVALESLKVQIDDVINAQNIKITELENLYNERLKNLPKAQDSINMIYLNEIEILKKEQSRTIRSKASLVSELEEIRKATEIERKRRIKRAAYDNEQDRFIKDRATLNIIKQNTPLSTTPLKAEDFDFGEEQSNIQIVKDVKNVENGYYLVLAVHSDVAKRDDFLTKAVASGQTDINFFYDVNTSKYYIYYEKFDDIGQAQKAIQSKGSKSYNGKMSMVKIEN